MIGALLPLAVCWTGAASVAFRFRGTRPASVLFRMAGAHVGINWTRPASVPSGAGAHVQGVRCVRHGMGGKVLPGGGTR